MSYAWAEEYGYQPVYRRRRRKAKKRVSRASRGVRIPNKLLEMMILQAVMKKVAE